MGTPRGEMIGLRDRSRALNNLRPIVLGQAISLLGDYISYFTLPFFIATLTGSALDLGLTYAFETIPMLLFGLAAGVLLDRTRLRRTLVFADIARAAAFIALAFGISMGTVSAWMVFAVAFIVGSMSVIFESGLQALLPLTLTDNLLVSANSRLQLARTIAFTVGPAIGGLLVARSRGFEFAFLLNGSTFIASAIFLTMIRDSREEPVAQRSDFRGALLEGLNHLWSDRRLKWATVGGTVTNLVFAPLEAVLVLFVTTRLAGSLSPPSWLEWAFTGAAEVGLFFACQAAIGSVGVALAPRVARVLPLGRMFVIGLGMLGAGFMLVSFSHSFLATIPAGIALAGVSWVNVALGTLRQTLTPEAMRGRVIAASRTIAWVGLPLGAAFGGALAEAVGLVPVYVTGSTAVLVLAVLLIGTPLWTNSPPPASITPDEGTPGPGSMVTADVRSSEGEAADAGTEAALHPPA